MSDPTIYKLNYHYITKMDHFKKGTFHGNMWV